MTFSALYLLPVLAIVILLQKSLVSIRGNLQYRSRRYQRRTRSRVLFYRALVVSLLLATAVAKLWPLPGLPSLVQGVLVATVLMIPFALYRLFVIFATRGSRYHQDLHDEDEDEDTSQETHTARSPAEEVPELHPTRSAVQDGQPSYGEQDTVTEAQGVSEDIRVATTSLHSQERQDDQESRDSQPEGSALDQTLSVGEQMETLDDLVEFHDIGNEKYSPDPTQTTDEVINPLEKAIAVAREEILEEPAIKDYSQENLPAKSSTELAEMVVRLRSDKMKLQKLVIAQKAVIDSEKQAHERTKVVVKDAISVMRHARHGQRIAEKIARRERAERQRIEKDYDKVRRQLDNALSTINTNSESQTEEA